MRASVSPTGDETSAGAPRTRPFVFEWGRKCDTVVPVGKNRRRLCARRSRDVAQFGSALDWGSRGRGFKSRRPDTEVAGHEGVHQVVGPFLSLRCRSSRAVHPLSFSPAFLMIVRSSRRTLCRACGVPVRVQNTRLWSCHSSAAERRDRWVLTDHRSLTEGSGAGVGGRVHRLVVVARLSGPGHTDRPCHRGPPSPVALP